MKWHAGSKKENICSNFMNLILLVARRKFDTAFGKQPRQSTYQWGEQFSDRCIHKAGALKVKVTGTVYMYMLQQWLFPHFLTDRLPLHYLNDMSLVLDE
jgi:hypothetical protein